MQFCPRQARFPCNHVRKIGGSSIRCAFYYRILYLNRNVSLLCAHPHVGFVRGVLHRLSNGERTPEQKVPFLCNSNTSSQLVTEEFDTSKASGVFVGFSNWAIDLLLMS